MEELKWEEYLPLADGEQLDTQGGTRTYTHTHTLEPETNMDILTHTQTCTHLELQSQQAMNFSAVVAMAIH